MEIALDDEQEAPAEMEGGDMLITIDLGNGPEQITAAELEALKKEADRQEQERGAILDALGTGLAAQRRDAINYRRQTGVEEQWRADEDAYRGMDDASAITRNDRNTRPVGMITPREADDNRSTIVLNITKPYCNAFAAKIISLRLRLSGRSWKLKQTPIPEPYGVEAVGPMGVQQANPMSPNQPMQEAGQSPQAQPGQPAPQGNPTQIAMAAVSKAQKWIDDRLVEGGFVREMRQVVDDQARIGVGVVKGPFPSMQRIRKFRDGKVIQEEDYKPTSKRVSAWRLYPDPACGENIHNGDYIFEFDKITRKRLEACKGQKHFLKDQIDKVLEEGPRPSDKAWLANDNQNVGDTPTNKNKAFDLWYFTGCIRAEEANAAGCECDEGSESANVSITMVNEHVIRMTLNPLDSGAFPYDVIPCSRVEGAWWGNGIAHDLRTPQRMVTGGIRRWSENTGLSSGPQIAFMKGVVTPANGSYDLEPNKLWIIEKGTTPQDIKNLFSVFNIDSKSAELMSLIQFNLKIAEDVTGMPAIMQGQQGSAPDVLGVVQILDSNSNAVASRVASILDDEGIVPHVKRYYEWMLEDESLPADMKGDADVEVMPAPDVAVEAKFAETVLTMAKDPQFKQNPVKVADMILRSNNWDPDQTAYTEEEWKRVQENQKNQVDPRIKAAELNAQSDQAITAAKLKADAEENDKDRQLESQLEIMREHVTTALAEKGMNVDMETVMTKVRAELGKVGIQIRAQKEMQAGEHAHQVMQTPVEPAGRAPAGKAVTH